ncbi:MAG: hypothetical protein ACYSX0_01380 [Planctomycetota bacterium]
MLVPFDMAHGLKYSIGVGTHSRDGYGSGGIPHAYLIGPDGTVAWHGHPARLQDSEIQSLLRKAQKFYLDPTGPEVKAAADAFRKGKLSKAEQLAKAMEHRDATYIAERVEALRKGWKGQVEKSIQAGSYDDAAEVCARIKKHFAGGEAAKWAADQEKKLKSDPQIKKDRKALKALVPLAEESVKLRRGDEKGRQELMKKVRKYTEKYEGTKPAELAGHILTKLENPGKK